MNNIKRKMDFDSAWPFRQHEYQSIDNQKSQLSHMKFSLKMELALAETFPNNNHICDHRLSAQVQNIICQQYEYVRFYRSAVRNRQSDLKIDADIGKNRFCRPLALTRCQMCTD